MTFLEFFAAYWWLMFPVFGMFMGVYGMFSSERRNTKVMDLIKSYIDQGKEPPPELLKMATSDEYASDWQGAGQTRRQNNGWSFVVFAALAAGFGVGWYFVQGESFAFAFLIVAVTMAVMAVGALFITLLGRK